MSGFNGHRELASNNKIKFIKEQQDYNSHDTTIIDAEFLCLNDDLDSKQGLSTTKNVEIEQGIKKELVKKNGIILSCIE